MVIQLFSVLMFQGTLQSSLAMMVLRDLLDPYMTGLRSKPCPFIWFEKEKKKTVSF